MTKDSENWKLGQFTPYIYVSTGWKQQPQLENSSDQQLTHPVLFL